VSSDRQRSQIMPMHMHPSKKERKAKHVEYGFKSHTPMMHALSWCFVMDLNLNYSADLTIKYIIAFRCSLLLQTRDT
jgi:hypothetical protein